MTISPLTWKRPWAALSLLAMLFVVAPPSAGAARSAGSEHGALTAHRGEDAEAAFFKALPWREVGPYRGGRVSAVEGVASQPSTYYFGSTGGGVWKTTDGGGTWKSVSDGFFGGSIGAVAVAPSDPNVVYAGTGEETLRGNVSPGSGFWRSSDAGKSWTFLGLADSQQVARIRVHPKDPDLVYAAVLGHAFGPSETRGVYRSRDGGRHWERILYAGPDAGAVDLAMDPGNPRVLFAATWRVRRSPYSFDSGGPGSALWRSADGGDHWQELTAAPRDATGLPKGTLGRIGVAVSPADPRTVYAIVEAAEGGVFRSTDGGDTWQKTNEERDLRQRAWYYSRIYADPKDADTAYVVNVRFWRSKDGGKTFKDVDTPHGDNHDLWIAPDDPKRMIESNDGGAIVSTDGGADWSSLYNQPTAQIYRVAVDSAFPSRLLGAQQDNSSLRIRHRSTDAGIGPADWEETAGGESGYIVADPADPDVVYGGSYGGLLVRLNHRTGEVRDTNPWPDNPMGHGDADLRYRFQWNFPIATSPHDPKTLYAAANVLFRTTDGGGSWQAISPDLTRDDKSKGGPTGGPITKDNTSVEYYGTIFYVAESPLAAGLLWVGSDDGLVHLTRDGGKSWHDVTPKGAPKWLMWNAIDPSPYEAGGAYLAGTLYKADDFRPYLYKTSDYGATWTKIVDGIPSDHFTRVVRADPRRRGLLFAGTERGLHVSFDDGGHWRPMQGKLPLVPVTDLLVHDGSLIAATQGRGFWMLDDLTPLEQWSGDLAGRSLHLFAPGPVVRLDVQTPRKPPVNQGANPPAGVVVSYLLQGQPVGTPVKLEFLTRDGKLIHAFAGEVKPAAKKPEAIEARGEAKEKAKRGVEAEAKEDKKDEKKDEKKEGKE
ncbi:MAG TPA: glycosyl hydrolase, partial [Thermoanaerobaculia bacterium]